MKEKILSIAMASVMVFAFPVYAEQEETENESDFTLEAVIRANSRENLLKACDSYLIEREDIKSGVKKTFYGDRELRYEDEDGVQWAIMEDERGYAHIDDGDGYTGLLIASADFLTIYDNPLFDIEATLDENIVEIKTEDDMLVVTTESSSENTKKYMEIDGVEYTEGDYDVFQYVLDKDTYILHSYNRTLYHADGSSEKYTATDVKTNVERPEIVQKLYERLTSTDTRTVTLILNPGTENETSYSAATVKGERFVIVKPEGYSYFYTDEECKEEYTGGDDKTKDITLYSVPDEKE